MSDRRQQAAREIVATFLRELRAAPPGHYASWSASTQARYHAARIRELTKFDAIGRLHLAEIDLHAAAIDAILVDQQGTLQ